MEHFWNIVGTFLEHFWNIFGTFWNIFGTLLEHSIRVLVVYILWWAFDAGGSLNRAKGQEATGAEVLAAVGFISWKAGDLSYCPSSKKSTSMAWLAAGLFRAAKRSPDTSKTNMQSAT